MFVITLFLCLCGILYVLIEWYIDGLLLYRSARCFHLKMYSELLSKLCRQKLIWVLYLCYLTFHEFCRTTESHVFACFAFVSSQSSCGFFLNSCMFCICVVTNVDCVLFNCLHNLHLCCYKRILGSV